MFRLVYYIVTTRVLSTSSYTMKDYELVLAMHSNKSRTGVRVVCILCIVCILYARTFSLSLYI